MALCSRLIETSQTSRIVMSNATVDALGMCFSHIPLLVWLITSSDLGNAKASISGTSNEKIPRFPFNLIANLG